MRMWKFLLILMVLLFGIAFSRPNDDPGDNSDEPGDNSDEPVDICNQKNCTTGTQRCPGQSNYRCIPKWQFCDGENDCRDNSDELAENCPGCKNESDFTCANKQCIPQHWICDSNDDCDDGSDEDEYMCTHRDCSESEFRCSNGRCAPLTWRCDHVNDCGDSSDELNCEYQTVATTSSEAPKLKEEENKK